MASTTWGNKMNIHREFGSASLLRFMTCVRRAGTVPLIVTMLLLPGVLSTTRGETPAASPAKPDRSSCDRSNFRVLVDVGHTAKVYGAVSARGVSEYEFNLRLAKQVEQSLIAAGFGKTVLLVTAEPPLRGLFKRASEASRLRADLFLSIHHDAVPDWMLETWEYEGKKHRFSDRFKGHSIFISNYNGDRTGSLLYARLLGNQLKASGLRYTPHYTDKIMGNRRRQLLDAEAGVYRYDQLIVLKETKMPAVLLESGSIVNRNEEVLLAAPERRSLISAAITEAVAKFCEARAPRSLIAGRAGAPNASRQAVRPAAATHRANAVPRP